MSSPLAPPAAPEPRTASKPTRRTAPDPDARASAVLGWSALALVLLVGAPIFLCMPVCFDVFHYDLCARSLLRGGVLYRDVFDNNLPGIVWLQACIRTLVGWRSESLHAVDLLLFSAGVVLWMRWVRPGARVWTTVALYAFYLFVPEPVPCQRDIWMLLPALVGLTLRQRQTARLARPSSVLSVVGPAALEGLCWGAAVWIKPFVLAPALACWLVGLFQVRKARTGARRSLTADALGLLAGGLFAGALGLAWLGRSGAWPYFWDILLVWNRDYGSVAHGFGVRYENLRLFMTLFLPWSVVVCVAVYLAAAAIRRELGGRPPAVRPSEPTRPGLALLAAFFLGWLFQCVCLQLPHLYVMATAVVPAVVLVGATYRWRPLPPARSAIRMGLAAFAVLLWTAAFQLDRVSLWARCWREGSTPSLQSLLVMRKDSAYAVDAAALAAVEDYLRGQGAGDGDVTCMSGCTHPLYLDMNLRPSTRFNQIGMATLFFTNHRDDILGELNASRQRFIVSDLVWTGLSPEQAAETDPNDPLALPPAFPDEYVGAYPWREPIVFRSGRYLVHRATGPAAPFWKDDTADASNGKYEDRDTESLAGKLGFRGATAARESVTALDGLYRRSEAAGDRAGQHYALQRALTLLEEERWAGKGEEAEIFRRWLEGRTAEETTNRRARP